MQSYIAVNNQGFGSCSPELTARFEKTLALKATFARSLGDHAGCSWRRLRQSGFYKKGIGEFLGFTNPRIFLKISGPHFQWDFQGTPQIMEPLYGRKIRRSMFGPKKIQGDFQNRNFSFQPQWPSCAFYPFPRRNPAHSPVEVEFFIFGRGGPRILMLFPWWSSLISCIAVFHDANT